MRLALPLLLSLAFASPAYGEAWLAAGDLSPQDVSVDDNTLAMNAGGDALGMWDHSTLGVSSTYVASRRPGEPFGPGVAFSGAGQNAYGPHGALDAAGNAIVVFRRFNGTHYVVQTGYRPAGGGFGPSDDLSGSGHNAGSQTVAMNPAGHAVAVWLEVDGNLLVRGAFRAPGGKFGPAVTLSAAGQDATQPDVAIDDAGNAIAVWTRKDGTHAIAQAAFRPAGGAFEPAVDLSAAGQSASAARVAMNGRGDAVAGWQRSDGANSRAQWAFRAAGGTFSAPGNLSEAGRNADSPFLALDGAGNGVAIWSRSNGTHQVVQYALQPAGGAFGPVVDLSPLGGEAFADSVAVNAAGQAVAVWTRNNGANRIVQASVKPPGGAFGGVSDLSAPGGNASDPDAGVDDEGTAVALWQRYNGSRWTVQTATYDAGSPQLRDVSVPSTATVGVPVTMSAGTFDRWSAVTGPQFAFGDGASATGGSVNHAYTAAGTYSVVVSATDAAGNAATATRQVVVTAPVTVATVLSNLRVAPASLRRGRTARIRFTLDRAATVALSIERLGSGRRVKGRCVRSTRSNRRRARCVRYVRVKGAISAVGTAGANAVTFTGRVGGRRLTRGRYRLTATPSDGRAVRTNFRIT